MLKDDNHELDGKKVGLLLEYAPKRIIVLDRPKGCVSETCPAKGSCVSLCCAGNPLPLDGGEDEEGLHRRALVQLHDRGHEELLPAVWQGSEA